MGQSPYPVSGDAGVGALHPDEVRAADFRRLPGPSLERLRRLTGVTATASDVLDEVGLSLVVPSDVLALRTGPALVVGQVLTLRYLPERRSASHPELRRGPSRLAHHTVFAMAQPGDVVVVEVAGSAAVSVLGGLAAQGAAQAGIAGCIVDGGIRDLDQVRASGVPVWSRVVTPRPGKWRVEAVAVNVPVACGGVQVHPGDVVIADETGICFVPADAAEAAIDRIAEVGRREEDELGSAGSHRGRR